MIKHNIDNIDDYLDGLSDEKYYIHSTIKELIHRGYSRKHAKELLKKSKLTKFVFDSKMKWTCFHQMDYPEWASWLIQEEQNRNTKANKHDIPQKYAF